MANNNEALRLHYFQEDELDKVNKEIKKDTDFEKKMDRVVSEQVDIQLDTLEITIKNKTENNFKERFQAFKKAVEEAERKIPAKPAEQTTGEAAQKQKEKFIANVEEKMQEKFGFFGAVLGWFGFGAKDLVGYVEAEKSLSSNSKPWDNIGTKIMAGIATFFLGKMGYDKLNIFGEQKGDNGQSRAPTASPIETPSTNPAETPEEKMKRKLNTHLKIGSFIVKEMGGEQFDGDDNYDISINLIKDYKYSDLNGLQFDQLKDNQNLEKEDFEKVKKALISGEMINIFNSLLSPERVEKLNTRGATKKILIELGITDSASFDWKQLEIKKLLMLLSVSLAGLTYLAYSKIRGLGDLLITRLMGIKEDIIGFDSIKEEAEEYEKEIMPRKLLTKLLLIGGFKEPASKSKTLGELEKEVSDKTYLPYLKKIDEFKTFVLKKLLSSEKYHLGEKDKILNNLSYCEIIELYLLFSGEIPKNIDKIDPFNSSIIYGWIYQVLAGSDSQGGYLMELKKEISDKNSGKIKEEDKKMISIVLKKVLDETVIEPLERLIKIVSEAVKKTNSTVDIIGVTSAIAALLYFTPVGRVIKLLGLRGSVAATSAVGFWTFYAGLSNDAKSVLEPVLLEKGVLIEEEEKTGTKKEEIEYAKLLIKDYTQGRLKISLGEKGIPKFEIDGKKYETDIGGFFFPDGAMLNEAYFGEKNGETYLCFDRSTGDIRINIKDILNKIGAGELQKNYPIYEDFFLGFDLELISSDS